MSGAVIFIPFCSQFHFSTQVEKTRKKSPFVCSYLKKFDFVGFFTKKQKTIKYERPHLHPYYSKDLIIFKCSIVKHVLNCEYSL